MANRLALAFVIFIACIMQKMMFSAIKTTMPSIVPFYADDLFLEMDRTLLGGIDAWEITHLFSAYIPADLAGFIYVTAWVLFILFFPTLLVMFDNNIERRNRYLVMYFWVWFGLGHILALAFMSAGPVFYDQVYGGNTFASLTAALQSSGVSTSFVGQIQRDLWTGYSTMEQTASSGISAFPSVHIGNAMLFGLYLYEVAPKLWPVSVVYLIVYQFLSVYLGWHYAVDGIASAILVYALWKYLKVREARKQQAVPASDDAIYS
ncbi:phosphatase PAP2 family protein [Falsihalocynthiibacter sp. SS001]|uniref:phosphatase PAP2 family protein n=1 Tax=Falsihalocynthiibacter sp. SS001 TaxID=3349698 RepID=UPI0036D3358E